MALSSSELSSMFEGAEGCDSCSGRTPFGATPEVEKTRRAGWTAFKFGEELVR
jgi:hypothetical protein